MAEYGEAVGCQSPYLWKPEDAIDPQVIKVMVTCWDTLDSFALRVHKNMRFLEFVKAVWKCFPYLSISMGLYYLPPGALWETSRVEIVYLEQLMQLVWERQPDTVEFYAFCSSETEIHYHYMVTSSSMITDFFEEANTDKPKPYYAVTLPEEMQRRSSRSSGSLQELADKDGTFEELVLERDDNMCVFCTSTSGNLVAARLIDVDKSCSAEELSAYRITDANDFRNGITLCNHCNHLFSLNLVGVRPQDWVITVSNQVLRDEQAMSQWTVLNGQSCHAPYESDLMADAWPCEALFQHRYDLFEKIHFQSLKAGDSTSHDLQLRPHTPAVCVPCSHTLHYLFRPLVKRLRNCRISLSRVFVSMDDESE